MHRYNVPRVQLRSRFISHILRYQLSPHRQVQNKAAQARHRARRFVMRLDIGRASGEIIESLMD